jgi:aldehyde dehydrogenase (NAD+)
MYDFVEELGIVDVNSGAAGGPFIDRPGGGELVSVSPIDGEPIAAVRTASGDDTERVVERAVDVFPRWRDTPAPKRGEIVRQIGERLRAVKEPLGKLVTLEMGKIVAEGKGEVQEMIDICDFAVGLSRQLYGKTMHSERPGHRMYEQWHPLGPVGIVTAFNFPVAVWSWNAAIAAVCGDVTIWKPSSETPLTAIAVQRIVNDVLARHDLEGVMSLVVGSGADVGERLINDERIPLVSATGSCRMGRHVGAVVAGRMGRTILELGGNNAVVVAPDADLDLAVRAILFGAVGTAGQRCTTTRRLIVHADVERDLTDRLVKAYGQVQIGDPLLEPTLMGPLVNRDAVTGMLKAIEDVEDQGGEILCGGKALEGSAFPGGCYVQPTLVRASARMPIVREETFAPILYLLGYESFEEAIALHNDVPQGLSSSIFTTDLGTAERFLSHAGSDCGIANVNIGTSGAEIGGAFGGEKDTGGGREAGSDAWKAYMRRQTNTINYSDELPLAQGIEFG